MTQEETYKVLGILKSGWPGYFRQMDAKEARGIADLWSAVLVDYPVELVVGAVKRFLVQDTKGYPPSIGQVIASINAISRPTVDEMTESEAWSKVKTAINNGNYGAKKEFDKLPAILQRIVGNSERIHEWAAMEDDLLEINIRPMICRSYNDIVAREREQTALPPTMARQLAAMAERPALTSPEAPAMPEPVPERKQFGESPAMKAFFETFRELAQQKAVEPITDDTRLDDAEAHARLEAQYAELKGAAQ